MTHLAVVTLHLPVQIRLTRRQDCVTRYTLLPRIVPYSSTATGIYSAWSPPSLAHPMRLSLFPAPVRTDQSQPNDVMNTFRNPIAFTRTYRRNASVILAQLVLCRHLAGVHGAMLRFTLLQDCRHDISYLQHTSILPTLISQLFTVQPLRLIRTFRRNLHPSINSSITFANRYNCSALCNKLPPELGLRQILSDPSYELIQNLTSCYHSKGLTQTEHIARS